MAYYRVTAGDTGITPSGKLNITDTAEKDVTNYAKAQVVDANLVAGNIKSGTSILGITGSYSGSGGGGGITLPANMAMGTFVVTSRTQAEQVIPHGLGSDITYAMVLIDGAYESGPVYTVIGGATVLDLNSGTGAIGTPSASYVFAYNGVRRSVNAAYANVHFDDTNVYIEGTGSYYLDPSYTYRVFAWAATTE